jgi:hypothetical protein
MLLKRWKESIFWAIAAAVFVFGFQSGSVRDALFSEGQAAGLWQILDYYFSFLGSGTAFSSHAAALFNGIAMTLYFFYLLGVKYYRKNSVVFGFYLFLLISAAANTFSRVSLASSPHLCSRYSFITVLLLAGVYLSLSERLEKRNSRYAFYVLSLVLTILLSVSSYRFYFNQYLVRHQLLHDSMLSWHVGQEGLPHPSIEMATTIMKTSIENGVFKPPVVELSDYYSKRISLGDPSYENKRIVHSVENHIETSELILVRGWAFLFDEDSDGVMIYLSLEAPYVQYIYSTNPRVRPDVTTHHKTHLNQGFLDHSGFLGVIKKADLMEGNYSLGVVLIKNNVAARQSLNRSIMIP